MRLVKQGARAARRRFVPSPAPGLENRGSSIVRGARAATSEGATLPALPMCVVGAPPRSPPGVGRPAPRVGGIRGLAVPPELRRRMPGASRATPEAAGMAQRERVALLTAQRKLLDAKQKLLATAEALRTELAAR